jgi:hypothetical protein
MTRVSALTLFRRCEAPTGRAAISSCLGSTVFDRALACDCPEMATSLLFKEKDFLLAQKPQVKT